MERKDGVEAEIMELLKDKRLSHSEIHDALSTKVQSRYLDGALQTLRKASRIAYDGRKWYDTRQRVCMNCGGKGYTLS